MFEAFIENSVILKIFYQSVQSCLYTANSIDFQLNQLFPKLAFTDWLLCVSYIERQWGHLPLNQCLETEFSPKYINIIEINSIYVTFTDRANSVI